REEFYLSIALGTALPGTLAAAAGITGGVGSPISVLASLGIASTDVAGQFPGFLPSLFPELDLAVARKYVPGPGQAPPLFDGAPLLRRFAGGAPGRPPAGARGGESAAACPKPRAKGHAGHDDRARPVQAAPRRPRQYAAGA